MASRTTAGMNMLYNRLFPYHPAVFISMCAVIGAILKSGKIVSCCATTALSCTVYSMLIAYMIVALTRFLLRTFVFAYTGYMFEERGKVTLSTKLWMLCIKFLQTVVPTPRLHSYDNGLLPSLPLPSLKDTIERYLESMQSVLSKDEYDEAKTMADEFVAKEGPKLQRYLWLKSCIKQNWVTDWWTKYAYLKYRESLLVNSSVGNLDLYTDAKVKQAARAANLLYSDVLRMRSIEDHAFQQIIDSEHKPVAGENHMNALTVTDRTRWAKNRQRIFLSNATNAKALHQIESSIYPVFFEDDVLDIGETDSDKVSTFMRPILSGDGTNRWVDKTFNYVITKNGRAGGTTEHSWGDGFEFDHIREELTYDDNFVFRYTTDGHCSGDIKQVAKVERLEFEFDNDAINEIEECYNFARRHVDNLDLSSLIFRTFGKGVIKQCRVSPDAFIQMAIQLAYYRLHKKFVLTYESSSARLYEEGRTETCRVASVESKAFVLAMCELSKDSNNTAKESVRQLLRTACDRHTSTMRLTMAGKGVDRHLFALYILSRGTQTSSPFLDYVLGQKWTISTSQAPTVRDLIDENKYEELSWLGAAFGPVDPKGYGICYRLAGEHSICAHVTALKSDPITDPVKLRDGLREALIDMRALFEGIKS